MCLFQNENYIEYFLLFNRHAQYYSLCLLQCHQTETELLGHVVGMLQTTTINAITDQDLVVNKMYVRVQQTIVIQRKGHI